MCSSVGSTVAVSVIVPGVSVTALATIVVVSGDSWPSRTRTMPDRNDVGVGRTMTLITSQLDMTRL